jgi:hypothetical protein
MDPDGRSGVVAVHDLTEPPVRIVELCGEHDLATLPDVRQALIHVRSLVVDLSAATFIDSGVVGALLRAARETCLVVVAPVGSRPRNVLDFLRAGDLVSIVDEREAALQVFRSADTLDAG